MGMERVGITRGHNKTLKQIAYFTLSPFHVVTRYSLSFDLTPCLAGVFDASTINRSLTPSRRIQGLVIPVYKPEFSLLVTRW